jgi:hypothetical protein
MTNNLDEDPTSPKKQKSESAKTDSEQKPKPVAPAGGKFNGKFPAANCRMTDQQPGQNKNKNNLEQITVDQNPKPLVQIPTPTQDNGNNPKGKLHRFQRAMKTLLGFKPSTVKIKPKPARKT